MSRSGPVIFELRSTICGAAKTDTLGIDEAEMKRTDRERGVAHVLCDYVPERVHVVPIGAFARNMERAPSRLAMFDNSVLPWLTERAFRAGAPHVQ
jgi:hypothetical protein